MPDLVKLPHGENISLEDWNFGYGDLDNIISGAVLEALTNSLDDQPPRAGFPVRWTLDDGYGGGPVSEPDTIYFKMPCFSGNADSGPMWSTTIEQLVGDLIENDLDNGGIGELKLAAKLRVIADRIEEAYSSEKVG